MVEHFGKRLNDCVSSSASTKCKCDQLLRVMDAFADDILLMSDDELVQAFGSAEEIEASALRMRTLFEEAVKKIESGGPLTAGNKEGVA